MFSPASQLKASGSEKMHGQGQQNTFYFENTNHPELEHKVKKASDKFSENLQVIANEPSLAFFRIQEHVRKTLPQLSERKHEVLDLQKQVQGSCFDTEYAINAVKNMEKSSVHFQNIQDLMKNSMFMKQQLQYEQSRRSQSKFHPIHKHIYLHPHAHQREQEKVRPSMYRTNRTGMMRTQTVDIPPTMQNRNDFSSNTQLPSVLDQPEGSPRGRSSSLSHGTPPTAAAAAAAAAVAAKAKATKQAQALR